MRGAAFLVFVSAATTPLPVTAQWRVGVELLNTYYRGSAVDTSGDPHARPGDGLTAGLRIERSIRSVHAALRLSYGKPGFSITGQGLTLNDKAVGGKLTEAAALLGFRVGGIGPSGAIRAELGPALHLWKLDDGETRSRVGAQVATFYEWPVSARFTGALRIEGALSKSWWDATDLPPEYRRQVTWRFCWGAGLQYRL